MVACVWGKASQGQGLRMGEQEEGCGWKSSCWVCWGRGPVLNKGPQLGFHNDISGGHAPPSAIQMGKLRRGHFSLWEGRGLPISYAGPFIFPVKTRWSKSKAPCQWSLSVQNETRGAKGRVWMTWLQSLLHFRKIRGHPAPQPQLWTERVLGSPPPCSRA